MKISEYNKMMAYLTRPKTKGGEVKVRKSCIPPNENNTKASPKVLFNQGTESLRLSPEDDLLFEGINYDAT